MAHLLEIILLVKNAQSLTVFFLFENYQEHTYHTCIKYLHTCNFIVQNLAGLHWLFNKYKYMYIPVKLFVWMIEQL